MKVNNFIKVLLFVPFLICIMESNSNYEFNKGNENNELNNLYSPSNGYNVQVVEGERSFNNSSEFFYFNCSVQINSVISDGNVTLEDYSIIGNEISCLLTNINDLGNITLSFIKDNLIADTETIYFAKSLKNVFYSSSLSIDHAKRAAGQSLNYSLFYEEDEQIEAPSISLMGIGAVGSVSGTFMWNDEQGNTHPLIEAKVRITIGGSWRSTETYTDKTGHYSVSYNDIWYIGSGKPMVHVYTENGNVKVHDGGTYEHTYEFNGNSGDWTYDYIFSPDEDKDSNLGKAMMIFQGAKNFSDYAKYLNGNNSINFCNFKFPVIDGSYYRGGTVYLKNMKGRGSTFASTYAARDIIGHEYGHHVQSVFGLSDNPGGNHILYRNNIDDQYDDRYSLENAKDRGHKLSWGEARPTYWSTIAQHNFSEDLKTINTVGDTYYSAEYFRYNVNSYPDNNGSKGDADEAAIQRILYKLASETIDDYDKFALGELTLWNIIIANKPHTFSDFIEDCYNNGYNKNNIGLLLGKYNVLSNNINITNNYFDKLPTFSWSTYMGSNNLRFNKFDLYFENQFGNIIIEKKNITASSNNCQITLNSDEWITINNDSSTCYNVYYVAWQTTGRLSGGYYSEKIAINKPTSYSSSKIQIKPNEWNLESRYYFSNETESDFSNRYSTLTKGDLTMSTDRLRCGYIENSYITLSPRRANAGRAYFEINFNKPVYSFLYSICLWSSAENLDGMAILQTKDSSGNWSIHTDLKSDITLTYRTNSQKRYAHYNASGIYGIRFETTATATGTRNKGRLCIDDLVLSTSNVLADNFYYITNYAKTIY